MKRLNFIFAGTLFLLFFLAHAPKVLAQNDLVRISEFAAVTLGTTADPDWVELYNESDVAISLDGWKLRDSIETSPKDLSGCINPRGYRKFDFFNRLNNAGDQIRLFDSQDQLVSFVEYFSQTVPAHQKGESTSKILNTATWQISNPPSPTDSVCPNSQTPAPPMPKIYSSFSLSEILSNPNKGEPEWVEIFNPNSFPVDISGWQLVDGANHSKNLEGVIAGFSYKVFTYSSGWLNNSGDKITLVSPAGQQTENYEFGSAEPSFSFAKDAQGAWTLTSTPTPGTANIISSKNVASAKNSKNTSSKNNLLASTGLKEPANYINDTLKKGGGANISPANTKGKVAGITEKKDEKNALSTLLIAVGVSLVGTAIVWPFIERKVNI